MSPKEEDCVFCQKIAAGDDRKEHILWRGQTAFMALNRYPYNNGHVLVLPYTHVPSLEQLPPGTLQEMMSLIQDSIAALRATMNPEGFNLGANLGQVAGAGIASHFHFHVVPRWGADTSFMTTLAETRTIPELLDQSYERLRVALAALPGRGARGEEGRR